MTFDSCQLSVVQRMIRRKFQPEINPP